MPSGLPDLNQCRRTDTSRPGGSNQGQCQDQAGLLATSSPVIAEQIKNNQLKVIAPYYNLASRAVSMVN